MWVADSCKEPHPEVGHKGDERRNPKSGRGESLPQLWPKRPSATLSCVKIGDTNTTLCHGAGRRGFRAGRAGTIRLRHGRRRQFLSKPMLCESDSGHAIAPQTRAAFLCPTGRPSKNSRCVWRRRGCFRWSCAKLAFLCIPEATSDEPAKIRMISQLLKLQVSQRLLKNRSTFGHTSCCL